MSQSLCVGCLSKKSIFSLHVRLSEVSSRSSHVNVLSKVVTMVEERVDGEVVSSVTSTSGTKSVVMGS